MPNARLLLSTPDGVPPPVGRALQLAVAERLIEKGLVSVATVSRVVGLASELGHDLAHGLVSQGHIRRVDYYRTLAEVLDLPFVDLVAEAGDPELLDAADRIDQLHPSAALGGHRAADGGSGMITPSAAISALIVT